MFKAKRIMSAVAAGAAALSASGALAATAQADATGFSAFKSIKIPNTDISVPTGTVEHTIKGQGLYIKSQRAGFSAVAPVCNTTMTFELSHRGSVYSSYTTPLNSPCTVTKWFPTHTWNKRGQTGKACAILRTDGAELSRQCHNVTT